MKYLLAILLFSSCTVRIYYPPMNHESGYVKPCLGNNYLPFYGKPNWHLDSSGNVISNDKSTHN